MESLKISPPESECSHRCQSTQHGRALVSAVSLRGISSAVAISYMRWLCGNCGQVADTFGRTALHLAASCGCRNVARWLVRHCGANVNLKDVESGYTPLHRSIFYGQIHVAVNLIQLGASVSCLDHDDLTALDHAMKERMPYVEYSTSNPCEVYTWGTNNNYTLGIGNQGDRKIPEIVEFFRKRNISIKQVAMDKFHSVFVAHDGRAFSCGHGHGGRLGLQYEKAALLPGHMKLSPIHHDSHVVAASVGRDHTVLLTEGGKVWTCGLNSYHQLGLLPPPPSAPIPRLLNTQKLQKLGTVKGVCAGRFHTVIWSDTGIMTCGLHAGQLGHPKASEPTQPEPRVVAALLQKKCHITHVAASDGATAIVTKKGDIYTLYEYHCRKIASHMLDVVKVIVVGGHLDSHMDTNILVDRGGAELKVAALTSSGKMLLWQESSQRMVRCMFSINRPLTITDVALSRGNTLLLATKDGEAFEGEIKARKLKKQPTSSSSTSAVTSPAFHEFLDKSDCEQVRVKRLLHIHRAVSVNLDPKGRNFAVVQTHPQAALLAVPVVETCEMREQMKVLLQDACTQDSIHDVVFIADGREFAAHRFVVASQSEPLGKLMESNTSDSDEVLRVNVSKVKAEVFEQILLYIYTGECDLLKPGICCLKDQSIEGKENAEEIEDLNTVSAYQIYSRESNNKKLKNKPAQNKQNQKKSNSNDPVKILQSAAKRFGLVSLEKKLDFVKCENGLIISVSEGRIQPTDINFDCKKHQDLFDVTVKCEDGKEIKAHKCILVARSEYFNSMLSHGWLESSQNSILKLPVPHKVLELLLDFMYKNDSAVVRKSDDLDLVCNVLVVADQLFANRLKEICEVTLAGLITLRNVAIILQFADTYNANQLKQCCMQYICLNLTAVLENRCLESVDDTVLEELSKYYQDFNPAMCKRIITPYSDAPSQSFLEAVAEAYPVSFHEEEEESDMIEISAKKNLKPIKKKPRVRKTSVNDSNKVNERTRNESFSSNHSINSDEEGKRSLSFTDLAEKTGIDDVTLELRKLEVKHPSRASPEKWVKIVGSNTKHGKTVQARLKAINAAKENPSVLHRDEDFSPLSTKIQSSDLIPSKSQSLSEVVTQTSPMTTTPSVPISPPPDLISDFPLLNSPPSSTSLHENHHRAVHKTPEVKNLTKISQKKRKKMLAEMLEQAEKGNQVLQVHSIPAWNVANESPNSSLLDIMCEEAQVGKQTSSIPIPVKTMPPQLSGSSCKQESPPINNPWVKIQGSPVGSPESAVKFCDIVADERKQRENWSKMRAKPLELTQLEDKAIEDLLLFYNAAGVSDERISVRRVITGTVAAPTWITSHH